VAAALFGAVLLAGVHGAFADEGAKTVPTFHCLSVYWSPAGGATDKKVDVKFREAGSQAWHEGLAMKYNPVENFKEGKKAAECQGDYRGSVVNLTPGTNYEIQLTLEGTKETATVRGTTWSEKFPIASTVKVPSGGSTLKVNKSGTAEGYVIYDGTGSTIDGGGKIDNAIEVNASYVILRGFNIKNTKANGIYLLKAHHVVIENCNISKWGSEDPKCKGTGWGIEMQSGVYSKDRNLHAIVIQRCKIHDPHYGSNSWSEKHESYHPDGPQAISFWDPDGNNVIRYNEFYSGEKHYFNDVIGGAYNGSYRGWPGHDSDIY
jgi:hypothetical protein